MSTAKEPADSPVKDRKRRRTVKPDKDAANATEPEVKKRVATAAGLSTEASKVKAAFNYEENEVDNRSPKKDLSLHKNACAELKQVMKEIQVLKKCDDAEKQDKIEQLRIHGVMQFVTLKKLNRMAHFRCKKARDKTNDEKLQIDQQNLRLQNLLYEVMHLQKEITKCLQFKSKDEDINLVPVDDFYQRAPDTISRPDVTKGDEHQQTLARLEWELEQRKQLSEQLKEALGDKDKIDQEIKSQKDNLESLQPKLGAILQATKPVQEHLGMPFDEIREQQATAMYLPHPLYILYMQASAYKDACDKHLTVKIEGDIEVAKAIESSSIELEEDSDSDNEDQEKSKNTHRRRNTTSDSLGDKKTKVLKKHPLAVQLVIQCKDGTLEITFHYLVMLGIIALEVKLAATASPAPVCHGDLLAPHSLLSSLYPGDTGNNTPNKANNYYLERLGLQEFSFYVPDVGRPYHWAQWLCGLQFPNIEEFTSKPQLSLSKTHMEATIKRIRERVKARINLYKQLSSLERGQTETTPQTPPLLPGKISTRLTSWKQSTFEDFSAVPHTQGLVSAELATDRDIYFQGTMERGSVKLSLLVVVNQNYPNVAPMFALSLNWKYERTGLNDDNMRDMEAEVNLHYPELTGSKPSELLSRQVERLLMCLDVYVESEADCSNHEGPVEFVREKIFPTVARGPGRAKPYKYNHHMGFFLQR